MDIFAFCPLDKKDFHLKSENTTIEHVLSLLGTKYDVKGGFLFCNEIKLPNNIDLKNLIMDKTPFIYYPNFLFDVKINDKNYKIEAKSMISKVSLVDIKNLLEFENIKLMVNDKPHHYEFIKLRNLLNNKITATDEKLKIIKIQNDDSAGYFLGQKVDHAMVTNGLFVVAKSNDPDSDAFTHTVISNQFSNIITKENLKDVLNSDGTSALPLSIGGTKCTFKYIGYKKGEKQESELTTLDQHKLIISIKELNDYDSFFCVVILGIKKIQTVNEKKTSVDQTKYYSPLSGEIIDDSLGSLTFLPDGWLCYDEELLEWCEHSSKCPKTGKSIV